MKTANVLLSQSVRVQLMTAQSIEPHRKAGTSKSRTQYIDSVVAKAMQKEPESFTLSALLDL